MRKTSLVMAVLAVSTVTGCQHCRQGGPSASIAPTDVDFGSVEASVKNTHCKQVPVGHNMSVTVTTTAPVGYSLTMTPGDFRWDPDTTIPNPFPPGINTYNIPIVFSPTYTGDQKASASVVLNDPNAQITNIVDLKGRGVCTL